MSSIQCSSMAIQSAHAAVRALKHHASTARKTSNQRFFKTGKGEYGEGDRFLGVTVPDTRKVARVFRNLPLSEVQKLVQSPWHEVRLLGVIIWSLQFDRGDEKEKNVIVGAYLSSTTWINNWDIVDVSAPRILGVWLRTHDRKILKKLVRSEVLWERRIAIVSTLAFIVEGDASSTLELAPELFSDHEDLMHKATGWMLREVGKRCGEGVLRAFLCEHSLGMPRTMLRYAIERFSPVERARWLSRKV